MLRKFVAGLLALLASHAFAHGTGFESLGAKGVAVQLYYVGGEPMAYAEAKVFSPVDPAAPFQQGRADKLGRVAFYPDAPGTWRVVAIDSEGHAVRAEVAVAADLTAAASTGNKREENRLRQWLFGAMLLNLGLILFIGLRMDRRIARWRLARQQA